MGGHELVAEVWRGDFLESEHHGSVVVLDVDSRPVLGVGQPSAPMYPRSSNKPVQATAMLRSGLDLDGDLLALASASHSGETYHVDGVRRILKHAGLSESDLQNTPDLPLGADALAAHHAAGHGPQRITMNCSGKHAAMLATCVVAGWPTTSYLSAEHPLQRAVRRTLEDLSGEQVTHVGVDGCGAPLFAVTLVGLARAFGRIATAHPGTPEGRVAAAMRAHPEYVGGTGRDVTDLMRLVPGLIAKDGAEGVYAAALPDGGAVALKIADGSGRARPPALIAALRHLGADLTAVDARPADTSLATPPVLGHGVPVGTIRPAATLGTPARV
ncbi:asparaginase [Actinocatenispora rupis]|uniref:Asparaginase n=1 Tax=Actinocatenispora rupis TaxID=519421 RepID=A0A8J3J6W5_9ACTN|nr:asparaginase [Actinocatenispora rupis]GID13082.1 asparaginase [Actinocatenispora rupis]